MSLSRTVARSRAAILAEQVVASGMSERIVDRLEAVEVEAQQGCLAVNTTNLSQSLLQLLSEHSALGKPVRASCRAM